MSRHLPDASFFVPAPLRRRAWSWRLSRAAAAAPLVLHLTHKDCLDGATSDLALRLACGVDDVKTFYLDPHETLDALERVAGVPGRDRRLVVSDLSFQKGEGRRADRVLAALAAGGWRVEWRDHHARQWDGAPLDDLRRHARLTLALDGKECGATLVATDLGLAEPWLRRLLVAVRDHDLWLQQDPLAGKLADAHHRMGSRAFVRYLLETRDPEDAVLLEAARRAAERRREETALAVATARMVHGAGGATVGVAFGDVPTNDVLHALYVDRGADVAVLFKPSGTFSLRSPKGVDVCHLIAQAFGGGGHANASGGRLDLAAVEYPRYWMMRGLHPSARAVVDAALREAQRAKDAKVAEGAKGDVTG